MGETIALAMSSPFGVGGSSFRTIKDRTQFVDTIAFPAYLRVVMDRAGLLDEDLMRNQDDEYNYRLRSLGYHLLLTPDVRSRYYSRGSLLKLWRQYYQYGVYKVRVMQKHPQQMRPRQFAPVLLVSGVLGGALLSLLWAWLTPFWILGLVAYAAVNLLASVHLARREGWQHLSRLPIVFATLHFGYGLGFLRGLVRFRNYWGKTGNRVEIINEGQR
jgi:GT2 family glycosyltransferase